MDKPFFEVVAALIWDGPRFMICQRPAHKARGLLWEFVGGKVEAGETREAALVRECREELDVEIQVDDLFTDVTHEYPDIRVHLSLFNARIVSGVPQKLEHNDIRFIAPAEIPQYDFCPADVEILAEILRRCGKKASCMKKLFLIGGTMGVGKTTVSQQLKMNLPNSVFLDGDWCWDAHPFQVTDETKAMVMDNICTLLSNFLACSAYENVIFCWVMHQQSIMDEILSRLDLASCRVVPVSLICTLETLTERIQRDISAGIRTPDVLERSLARLPMYDALSTIPIDTTGKTPETIAAEIAALV